MRWLIRGQVWHGRAAAALGVLLVGVALVVGGRAAAAPQATIVRCDPATVAGPVGSQIDIDIYVENVVELYGADLSLIHISEPT